MANGGMINEPVMIRDIIDSPFCLTSKDGKKVYNRIEDSIKSNKEIILSFQNTSIPTCLFLQSSIINLYKTFDEKQVDSCLKFEDDTNPIYLGLIEEVISEFKESRKPWFRINKLIRRFWRN